MKQYVPFQPQFAGPLDVRFSVDTYSDLAILASSGIAYPFMKVVCRENGYTYELQANGVTWKLFTATGPQGPKGEKGDPGEKGDKGDNAITAGTVQLVQGSTPALEITIDATTGKLDFKLTLPSYILGGTASGLKTTDKTLIGAINEVYDMAKAASTSGS